MLPLLGVTSTVKDSASVRRGGNSAQVSSAQTESWNKFQQQMKLFWAYALDFLKWAPHMDLKDRVFYVKSYYVLLYLGNVGLLPSNSLTYRWLCFSITPIRPWRRGRPRVSSTR